MTTSLNNPGSDARELLESELDNVVGGAGSASGAVTTAKLIHFIHDDLIGHASAQNEAAIAADIKAGGATAAQAIHLIETGAAADGSPSADLQLMDVQQALINDHDSADAKRFAGEEVKRLESGVAQTDVGRLFNAGDLDVLTARSIVFDEAKTSGLTALGVQLLKQEKQDGGNAAIEEQIGLLASVNAISSITAIATVEQANTAHHKSVDQALINLESQAQSKGFESSASYFFTNEETNRLQDGATLQDLAQRLESGKMTGAQAANLLVTEGGQAGEGAGAEITQLISLLDVAQRPADQTAIQAQLVEQIELGLTSGQSGQALMSALQSSEISYSEANSLANQAIQAAAASSSSGLPLAGMSNDDLITLEGVSGGNAIVEAQLASQLAGHLLDGSAASLLANGLLSGNLYAGAALNILNEAIMDAQQQSGAGMALGAVALAQMDSVLQSDITAIQGGTLSSPEGYQIFQLDSSLQTNYGSAIQYGQALEPLVSALSPNLALEALATGQQIANISDPTTGVETSLVAKLMSDATAAGSSVDAALAAACYASNGQSEVIKGVLTDRLMGGQAESDIANQIVSGSMTADAGVNILAMEVGALAAGNPNGAALGFDRPTAVALVLARLDIAAVNIQNNQAGQPAAGAAAALQSHIEQMGGVQIAVGLGALMGLLHSDMDDNMATMSTAQTLLNNLLPTAIAQTLVGGMMQSGSDDAIGQLTLATQDEILAVANAYQAAANLVTLEQTVLNELPGESIYTGGTGTSTSIQQTLATYGFTETGVSVGVETSGTYNLGDGFQLSLSASANANANVNVNGTTVTIQAAAGASAEEVLTLNPQTQIIELVQAIADGAIMASPTGVTGSANASVGVTISVTNTQSGSLGLSGLTGMETTTYTEQAVATANVTGAIGEDTNFSYGAYAGASISLTETGSVNYQGVQVSGSATITTGEVGENFSADANFQGGNINISFAGGAAAEIFGVQFSAMLTLPTGAVVSALQNIGANVGSTVAAGASAAAQAVAAEAMSISNTVQNAALSFGNEFEDIGDDIGDAIGSIY